MFLPCPLVLSRCFCSNHYVFFLLYQDGLNEFDKLVKFLDVDIDEKLKHEIIDMCGFEKMQADKVFTELLNDDFLKDGYSFFRKGAKKV